MGQNAGFFYHLIHISIHSMKKTFLIAGGIFSLLQVHAQQNSFKHTRSNRPGDNRAIITSVLKQQFAGRTAQKPTGTQQRVIAQGTTYFDGPDTYQDSLTFSYTGSNGSKYDFNSVGYNEEFDPAYAPMYSDYRYSMNPLNLLADTIVAYSEGELTDLGRAFYRSDKKIDSVTALGFYQGVAESIDKTKTSYSSSGALLRKVLLESNDNGNSYDTVSYSNYSYNNDYTKVLADTNVYDPASGFFVGANRYVYNGAGRLDTVLTYAVLMGDETFSRMLLDYYSNGTLRKTVQQNFVNGAWETSMIDSLGYSSNGEYLAYWLEQPYTDGTPDLVGQTLTRQFAGANGYPDSVLQYSWDDMAGDWVAEVRWNYTYNEYNNPTRFESTAISGTSEEAEGFINFYYELFDNEVSVKPVADNKDFRVYPNPFDSKITIEWKGKAQSDVTVRLVNMVGQEVYRSVRKLNAGSNTLDIPGLSKGNYILLLQDATGKSWSTKMVKQ